MTIERLDPWSEQYPPWGSSAGQGILKNLGTPPLEKLELFTREVIQNCWDAADDNHNGPVTVRISCEEIDHHQINSITSNVLVGARGELSLAKAFEDSPRLLKISDRGTHGLGGPTNAQIDVEGPTDFRDFLRNVGEPPDKPMGGGSFGFGKAALYLVSLAHCIVIHTRAANEFGELETRIMAAGLSAPFSDGDSGRRLRYTGRHAWGVSLPDGSVDPVRNGDCGPFRDMFGLDAFGDEETGTDIVIVAPDLSLGGQTDSIASAAAGMELIARSIAWHFWPKIYGPQPSMHISVWLNEEEVAIPGPLDNRRIAAFVSALYELEDESDQPSVSVRTVEKQIEVGMQKKHVGDLVIQTHMIPVENEHDVAIAAPDSGEPLNHVALMRNAELVVKYVKGPELPAGLGGYAGVFRVAKGDAQLDNIFRRSEPPSHDDWIHKALEDRSERMFVNRAVKSVEEAMDEYVGADAPTGRGSSDVSLGQFSKQMASLVPDVSGEGARRKPPGKRPGGQPTSAPLEVISPLTPKTINGQTVLEASVRAKAQIRVLAIPSVVSDGTSAEKTPPEGALVPEVLRWIGSSGEERPGDSIDARKGESWTVVVRSPGDSMIRVQFEVEE